MPMTEEQEENKDILDEIVSRLDDLIIDDEELFEIRESVYFAIDDLARKLGVELD